MDQHRQQSVTTAGRGEHWNNRPCGRSAWCLARFCHLWRLLPASAVLAASPLQRRATQAEQRGFLETMTQASRTLAKHYLVARVLLMSDQSQGGPSHTDGHIAEALDISHRTVIRIKQRFVQGGLEA